MIDLRSAYLLTGILYLFMPLATWVVLRRERVPGIYAWCLGGLLAGVTTNLITIQTYLPTWVLWGVLFFLIPVANLLRIQAMLLLVNRPLRWGGPLAALLAVAMIAWGLGPQGPRLAIALHALLYALVAAVSIWVGCRRANRSAFWIGGFFLLVAGLVLAHGLQLEAQVTVERFFQSGPSSIALVIIAACGALATYVGYTGLVLEEIGKQKVAAEAEARSRADNARLSAQLAQLQRREMVGQMSDYLTHEIGQPLTALRLNGQAARALMAAGSDPEQGMEVIDRMIREAERLQEVVERVRRLSMRQAPQIVPVDLARVVDDVVGLVAVEAATRGVALKVDRGPGRVEIEADRIQIAQVLMNIVRNGIDAAEEFEPPRWVRVSVGQSTTDANGQAWVRVEDSGIGFSDVDLQLAGFDLYTTKPGGFGLGLAISRQIAMLHEGRLDWRNGDAGAVVELRLPLSQAPDGGGEP